MGHRDPVGEVFDASYTFRTATCIPATNLASGVTFDEKLRHGIRTTRSICR